MHPAIFHPTIVPAGTPRDFSLPSAGLVKAAKSAAS
jgi:hypothetical protein